MDEYTAEKPGMTPEERAKEFQGLYKSDPWVWDEFLSRARGINERRKGGGAVEAGTRCPA